MNDISEEHESETTSTIVSIRMTYFQISKQMAGNGSFINSISPPWNGYILRTRYSFSERNKLLGDLNNLRIILPDFGVGCIR